MREVLCSVVYTREHSRGIGIDIRTSNTSVVMSLIIIYNLKYKRTLIHVKFTFIHSISEISHRYTRENSRILSAFVAARSSCLVFQSTALCASRDET